MTPDLGPAVSPPPAAVPAKAPSFEQAMERLEEVVRQMENSKLPLEDLIRCFEEGTGLVKVCNERLAAAETRIEIIARQASGDAAPAVPTVSTAAAPAEKVVARDPKPAQNPPGASGRSTPQNNEVSLF